MKGSDLENPAHSSRERWFKREFCENSRKMTPFVAVATRALKLYNDRNQIPPAPGTTPKKDSTKGPTMSVMNLP
jgi:hypothetical protein